MKPPGSLFALSPVRSLLRIVLRDAASSVLRDRVYVLQISRHSTIAFLRSAMYDPSFEREIGLRIVPSVACRHATSEYKNGV